MNSAIFQCRIQLDDDAQVNPVHLCEEIQAYLNAHVSNYDEDTQDYVNAKVAGYKFEYDGFVPFHFQEEF